MLRREFVLHDASSLGYNISRYRGSASHDAWPVQFLPAFNTLTREAMENADTANFDGVALRVVRPDYLAVIALSVGRAKDCERVLNLLESNCTNREEVGSLAAPHGMSEPWLRFARRFLDA